MKICPTCDGEGQFQIEYDVIDYVNGGHIATKWVPCKNCGGSGEDFDVLDEGDE